MRLLALLAVFLSFCVGQADRDRGDFGLGAKRTKIHPVHPGHAAQHVVRLHRYDHSGLDSMLEEEHRWHKGYASGTSLLERSEHDATRSTEDSRLSFLTLSIKQSQALQEHHDTWKVNSNTDRKKRKVTGLDIDGQDNGWLSRQRGKMHPVTALSSLSSQYVGPLGIGTKAFPEGCIMPKNSTIEFVQSGQSDDAANSANREVQCRAMPQSNVWVVFDTGSTNIWISSDLCTQGPCTTPGRVRYDHHDSLTYHEPENLLQLHVEFGTGKLEGPQGVDDLSIGTFRVLNQTFALIQGETGSVWNDVPLEGIMGLAFPSMSANGATPFLDNVIQQKGLQNNEFAFYFSRNSNAANAVFWGGVDDHFFKGPIRRFRVIEPYYWALKLVNFRIGDKVLIPPGTNSPSTNSSFLERKSQTSNTRRNTVYKAILDSGTTFFTAGDEHFQTVMDLLPTTECSSVNSKTHPDVVVTLEDTDYNLVPLTFDHTMYMNSFQGQCSPAFMNINIPAEHGPGMVLGEVFMRYYYTVFERGPDGSEGEATVGLAESKQLPDTIQELRKLTSTQPLFHQQRRGNL